MSAEMNDLEILAYCFVADELSADEAARFELRLASDQSAREAVARAVQLTETVAALPHSVWYMETSIEPAKTTPRWQLARWAALAAAACVAAIFAVSLIHRNADWRNPKSNVGLAEAWTTWRAADGENMANLPVSAEEPLLNDAELFADDQLADDLQSPDWLLAAVTAPSTMPTDDGEPSPIVHE